MLVNVGRDKIADLAFHSILKSLKYLKNMFPN